MLGRKIKKLKNWLQNRHNLQLFRLRLAEDRQKTALYRAVLISHELSATGAPLMLLRPQKQFWPTAVRFGFWLIWTGRCGKSSKNWEFRFFIIPDFVAMPGC